MQFVVVDRSTTVFAFFCLCSKIGVKMGVNTLYIFHIFSLVCLLLISFFLFIADRFYSDFFEIRTYCDLSTQAKTLVSFVTLNESLGKTLYWLKNTYWTKRFVFPFWLEFNFPLHLLKGLLSYSMEWIFALWHAWTKQTWLSTLLIVMQTLRYGWLVIFSANNNASLCVSILAPS